MLDDTLVDAYLNRIGVARPERLDAESLRLLHAQHELTVPFETIDYHLGKEIFIDERVVEKIVYQNRGGGCGEINNAFHYLLEALGFDVTLHQGRVWLGHEFTPPYNHSVTTVRIGEQRWLSDVGLGRSSRYPLLLESPQPQEDPHGTFSTKRVADNATDVFRADALQYRFYDEPVVAADGMQVLWWYRTSPDSPFLQNLSCTLPTENGRIILRENKLVVIDGDERRIERITNDDDLLAAYDKYFGIKLDAPPKPSPHVKKSMRMSYERD
ncbi:MULTISPECIES: arylamine N-acetyltransferase [unclassified Micromonospora]|uniref:arylamine N-acetyltransferase family protein n=1 Tax=unclassified Micromonospora TaxID=2617518 RepID=UPI0007DB4BEE|nr:MULTISPECIES: arylamine N-acetyltransferase [unclassified Micromonospora]MBQ1059257.1 arylamine N-acetyltransferase [Micromonospora sp. C41]